MSSPVEIRGLGLVTSVGLDLAHSAASIRAGLNRFQSLEDIKVYDGDEFEAPIAGAPINILTRGYVQQARWLRLAERAVKGLLDSPGLKQKIMQDSSPLMVIWALPDMTDLFRWPKDQAPELLQKFLLEPLARRLGIPLITPENGWFCEGSSGGPRALRATARSLAGESLKRVLCIGVDSLTEPLCLQHLAEQRRLKTPENPTGLIPGESAAAVLLESGKTAGVSRLRLYQALHKSLPLDRNPENWRTLSAYEIGRELGRLILDALGVLNDKVFKGDIYLDLNGEEWRAVAWSSALIVLKASNKIDLDACEYRIPGTSLGDIGSASSVAMIGLAAESFSRRYARSNLSLILSISDQGDIGVILIGL